MDLNNGCAFDLRLGRRKAWPTLPADRRIVSICAAGWVQPRCGAVVPVLIRAVGVVEWIMVGRTSRSPANLRKRGRAADGITPCRVKHAVEYGHAHGGFGALARQVARMQMRIHEGLVAAHGGFDQ